MPVYIYRCSSCGVQFEKHQGFHDTPLKTCPECKKKTLKKVITPTKVIFKGSGFYVNDHKSTSGGKTSSGSKSHSHDNDQSHAEGKTAEKSTAESKSDKKAKSKSESKSSEKSE